MYRTLRLSSCMIGAALVQALKPMDYKKPPPLSPEEKEENARRAKEYSRLKMVEHRAWQKDLQTKLNLKMAAIAALPEELRADCLTFHISEAPPLNRNIFTLTPPIKDFQKLQQQRQRKRARKGTPGSKKRRA